MASSVSVNVRNLNASKISFVKGQAKAGRNAPINMKYGDTEKTRQNFQLIIPQSMVRLLTRTDERSGVTSYSLSYTLSDCDNYAKERSDEVAEIGKLYNFLIDLEETVIKTAIDNSVDWFGKKRSEEAIRDGFNRIVRVSSDKIDGERVPNGKYPPSWLIKIPIYDGKVTMDNEGIVNARGHPVENVTPDTLTTIFPNNTKAKLAVTGSVYVIAGGGFGISWRLRAAQIFPSSKVNAADLFGTTEEEEEEETTQAEESQPAERPATPPEQPAVAATPAAPARKKRTNA